MAKNPNWSRAEDDLLESLYGLERYQIIAKRLKDRLGTDRTPLAVLKRATYLGLDCRTNQDGITVVDAARELGTTRAVLDGMRQAGKLKTHGNGRVRIVSFAEFDRLKALFPQAPERSMALNAAARLFGYSQSRMLEIVKAGIVKGVKRGDRWFLDADHVEWLAAQMKAHRTTRLDCSGNARMAEMNARRRKYPRRKEGAA